MKLRKMLCALFAAGIAFASISCSSDGDTATSVPNIPIVPPATATIEVSSSMENVALVNQAATVDIVMKLSNAEFTATALGYSANKDVSEYVKVDFGQSTELTATKVVLKEKIASDKKNVATFTVTYSFGGFLPASGTASITVAATGPLVTQAVTSTALSKRFSILAPDVQILMSPLAIGIGETVSSEMTVKLNNGKTFSSTAKSLLETANMLPYLSFPSNTADFSVDAAELKAAVGSSDQMIIVLKVTGKKEASGKATVSVNSSLVSGVTADISESFNYSVTKVAVLSTTDVLTGICSAAQTAKFTLALKGGEFDTSKIASLGYNNPSDNKHYVKDIFTFSFANTGATINWVCLESISATTAEFTVDYYTPKDPKSGVAECTVSISADAIKDGTAVVVSKVCQTAFDFTKNKVANADGTNTLIIQELEKENGFVSCSRDAPSTNGTWTGYTGQGFYDNLGDNSSIVYSIYAEKDVSDVSIDVRYALWSDAQRAILVDVNGTTVNVGSAIYTPTTSKQKSTAEGRWKYSGALTGISLKAGNNSITLHPADANSTGTFNGKAYTVGQKAMVNIDYVKITGTGISAGTGDFYTLAIYTENESFGTVAATSGSTGTVNKDTPVTIQATPKAGYKFDCWMGTIPSRENPYSFTVGKNIAIQAHFIPEGVTQNPTGLVGYASITGDNGTGYTITGGTGAATANVVTIASRADLIAQADLLKSETPAIFTIKGTIKTESLVSEQYTVGSNKTIYGATGADQGRLKNIELNVQGQNIIIRNMMFGEVISWDVPVKSGADDALSLNGARHVWIDHCEFQSHLEPQDLDGNPITSGNPYYSNDSDWAKDFYDGLLDIKNGASWITISNCYFHDHYKACLCASGDDSPKTYTLGGLTSSEEDMRVTFQGNYWKNINARQPMFRYGKFHVFDSYFDAGVQSGSATCINVRAGAEAYIDANTFVGIKSDDYTVGFYYGDGSKKYGNVSGKWTTTNNTGKKDESTSSYMPPYAYMSSKPTDAPTPGVKVGVGVLTVSELH